LKEWNQKNNTAKQDVKNIMIDLWVLLPSDWPLLWQELMIRKTKYNP